MQATSASVHSSQPTHRSREVREIFPSSSERASGRFESHNMEKILEGLHSEGIIVIRDIIDPAHLDAINTTMLLEVEELSKKAHYNFNIRNIQHAPPLLPESLVFDDVYLNPLLLHAVTLYLGLEAKFNFISGNTALPKGLQRQPVHSDLNHNYPSCPFYVVAYIPLINSTPEVGATEFWPGTHLSSFADQVSPDFYEVKKDLLGGYTGYQPVVPKGSLVLRDMRLWHSGMPNHSDQTRCMLGLAFCAAWYRTKHYLPVPEHLVVRFSNELKKWGVNPLFQGVSDQEYLERKDTYSFTFQQDVLPQEVAAPPQNQEKPTS